MKSLKPRLFAFSLLAFAAVVSSCNTQCVTGSGKETSETRSVSDFAKIETGGTIKLILKQGPKTVKVFADDNIQKLIETDVEGNTLKIDMDGNFCNSGPVTVYVSNPDFQAIRVSGAVEVTSEGRLNTKDFYLGLSGSCEVNLDLSVAGVKTEASGSSVIYLKGQAGAHDLDISGSGKLEAFDFVVGNYKINTSGSSECRINVLNSLDVNTSGASDIEYKGNPKQVSDNHSGASTVKKVQ